MNPLRRFLTRNIGRPYDEVYRKIPSKMRRDLEWLVVVNLVIPRAYEHFFVDAKGELAFSPSERVQKPRKMSSCVKEVWSWDEPMYHSPIPVEDIWRHNRLEFTYKGCTYVQKPGSLFWYKKILKRYETVDYWKPGILATFHRQQPVYATEQVDGKIQKEVDVAFKKATVGCGSMLSPQSF